MIRVRDISTLSLEELKDKFQKIAHTSEFSAAATCGFNTLSQDRKMVLIEQLSKAGLKLETDEVDYAVSTIANRLINRA